MCIFELTQTFTCGFYFRSDITCIVSGAKTTTSYFLTCARIEPKQTNKQTNKNPPFDWFPKAHPKKWIGETPNFLEAVQERFVGYVMRAWRMKMKEWGRNPDIHTPRVPLPVPPGSASTIWLLVVAQADTRPFYRRTWNTASVLPGRPDSSRSSIGYRMAV